MGRHKNIKSLKTLERDIKINAAAIEHVGAHAGNAATWLQWKRFLIEKERAKRDANRRGKP